MANRRTQPTSRGSRRNKPGGSLPWVSELQLNAYLEARDALRRAHAASLAISSQRTRPSPPATA